MLNQTILYEKCPIKQTAPSLKWSGKPDSNRRPSAWKADALAN